MNTIINNIINNNINNNINIINFEIIKNLRGFPTNLDI